MLTLSPKLESVREQNPGTIKTLLKNSSASFGWTRPSPRERILFPPPQVNWLQARSRQPKRR